MEFAELANELVLHIFQSCASIPDALRLASTCKHFHSIFNSSNRLPILYQAAEAQLGPLDDAIRLVTHNNSQAVHLPRAAPPQSFALLQRLVEVGRTANQWASLYPSLKWRGDDSASRRSISSLEMYRLRRACYRMWLYTLAFHLPQYPRTSRLSPPIVRLRAALLRPWPAQQLAEILDLHAIFRHVVQSKICPSNGTVIRRHKQRYPEDPFPLVSVTAPAKYVQQHARFQATMSQSASNNHTLTSPRNSKHPYGLAVEGWGDEIAHYYVVEDMLKLDPGQLMYLYSSVTSEAMNGGLYHSTCSPKGLVDCFVLGLGDWFENNGETLIETMGFVIQERGGDLCELKDVVEEGWEGIARVDAET